MTRGLRVPFVCWVCTNTIWLRPGEAKRRKTCSCACRNTARFATKQQQLNRLRRVQFVHGFSLSEARAYLRGWHDGRGAAYNAYRHQKSLRDRPVGSAEWEGAA